MHITRHGAVGIAMHVAHCRYAQATDIGSAIPVCVSCNFAVGIALDRAETASAKPTSLDVARTLRTRSYSAVGISLSMTINTCAQSACVDVGVYIAAAGHPTIAINVQLTGCRTGQWPGAASYTAVRGNAIAANGKVSTRGTTATNAKMNATAIDR